MLARGSPKPLYRQLKDRILREVERGVRAPHSRLPSEREWVDKLGVSRITVRQALSELVQQGYLYTVPGKGFFVGERKNAREWDAFLSFTAATEARGERPTSRVLGARLIRATARLADTLGIAAGTETVELERVRLANGAPVMIQRAYLSHALCPGLLDRDLATLSLFATLREAYGIELRRAETIISARLADKTERRLLELAEPGVVLTVDQTSHDGDGKAVEHVETVMHPERHPLSLVQEGGQRTGSGVRQ